MLDSLTEPLVPLEKAANLFPAADRPHRSTLYRYALKGGKEGILLETIVVRRTRYTSRQAVQRFIAATSAANLAKHRRGQSPPTASERQHDRRRAGQVLEAAGIK